MICRVTSTDKVFHFTVDTHTQWLYKNISNTFKKIYILASFFPLFLNLDILKEKWILNEKTRFLHLENVKPNISIVQKF